MNHRRAAAAKNSEPMIALWRGLTGKTWGSRPPISPGKSQQTMPATAKTMARIILIVMPTPPYRQQMRRSQGCRGKSNFRVAVERYADPKAPQVKSVGYAGEQPVAALVLPIFV
jgi:hypothetical protein